MKRSKRGALRSRGDDVLQEDEGEATSPSPTLTFFFLLSKLQQPFSAAAAGETLAPQIGLLIEGPDEAKGPQPNTAWSV